LAQITVDCHGPDEELSAVEAFLTDALHPPFAGTWRDPDDPGHAEAVTVLGVASVAGRRGILLRIRRSGGKDHRDLAEQVWADASASEWDRVGGLPLLGRARRAALLIRRVTPVCWTACTAQGSFTPQCSCVTALLGRWNSSRRACAGAATD
jgi:hypothetical protein